MTETCLLDRKAGWKRTGPKLVGNISEMPGTRYTGTPVGTVPPFLLEAGRSSSAGHKLGSFDAAASTSSGQGARVIRSAASVHSVSNCGPHALSQAALTRFSGRCGLLVVV